MKRALKNGKKSGSARRRPDLSLPRVRAALSNGSALLLEHVDGRLAWTRRLRDLTNDSISDLGGRDMVSAHEMILIKRNTMLVVQLEMLECRFAEQDGVASSDQLRDYQRCVNTCRRTLEALGLQRRQHDVTPNPLNYAREFDRRKAEEVIDEEVKA
jgi:hypothetical protein